MRIVFSSGARRDATEAVRHYLAAAGAVHASGFERELVQALDLIARLPDIGTRGMRDTRAVPLRRYPYSVHYRVAGDSLFVIAVAHHRRRPGYWATRT